MNLLILAEALIDAYPQYRGTYRITPSYRDDLPEEHIVNQTILQLISEADDAIVLNNVTFAFECVKILNQQESRNRFEVVEIAENDSQPMYGGNFLGYDLSTGYYSLLSWGLDLDQFSTAVTQNNQILAIRPLIQLIQAYFQPKLNDSGLFDKIEDAKFCLDCMMAIQSVRPGMWENEEVEFTVVGLWKISDTMQGEEIPINHDYS